MQVVKSEKRKSYIYKITSPSGRIYIGQTNSITKRKAAHRAFAKKSDYKLYRSLNKYGWSSHEFEVIEEGYFSKEELNDLEVKYISQFDCFKTGLNMTLGGGGSPGTKRTEYQKEKQRQRMSGENNPFYGKKHSEDVLDMLRNRPPVTISEEGLRRISVSSLGNKHALGYTHSEEEIEKITNASKGNKYAAGRKHGEDEKESRAKMARKRIYSSVLNKEFTSVKECAEYLGLDDSTISCMFSGLIKNRFGLKRLVSPRVRCNITGKEYFTIRDAANDANIKEALMSRYLRGIRYNRTSMVLINESI